MKVEINSPDDEPNTRCIRPAQFISRIHGQLVEKYRKRQHFIYRGFVVFMSINSTISVYTQPREHSPEQFIFIILIESENDTILKWEHTYHWGGSWFTSHLKLLCLLDP